MLLNVETGKLIAFLKRVHPDVYRDVVDHFEEGGKRSLFSSPIPGGVEGEPAKERAGSLFDNRIPGGYCD